MTKLLPMRFITYFLAIAILLFPYQNIGLKLATSRYDISAFILIGLTLIKFFGNGKIKKKSLIYILIFLAIQISLFGLLGIAPLHRFISGLVWLGGLLLMILSGDKFRYKPQLACKTIVYTMTISGSYVLIQYFYFSESRPLAWFAEPSYAGLAFYSVAAGIIAILIKFDFSIRNRIIIFGFFMFFIYGAFLTKSLHFTTFLITCLLTGVLVYFNRLKSFLSVKKIFILSIITIVLAVFLNQQLQTEHVAERVNLSSVQNVSLLSWLRGLDQALSSLTYSPIFGLGLGATGHFEFESINSVYLQSFGVTNLNLFDSYSLTFRLIIETGILFLVSFLIYFIRRLNYFRNYCSIITNEPSKKSVSTVFNFIFATSIIIGSLIKEPLYAQSFLYVAVFLFSSTNLTIIKYASNKNRHLKILE